MNKVENQETKEDMSNRMKRKNDELYDPTNPDSDSDDEENEDTQVSKKEQNEEKEKGKTIEPANKMQKGSGMTSIKLTLPSTIGKQADSLTNNKSSDDDQASKESKEKNNGTGTQPIKTSITSDATLTSKDTSSIKTKTSSITTTSLSPSTKQLPTGNLAPSSKVAGVVKNVSDKVAKVFGSDDEDDTEEMPFEARMKMRNIGRNTPTSTGPNSYGKTSIGFTDQRKLFEKQLKEKADELLKEETARKNRNAAARK